MEEKFWQRFYDYNMPTTIRYPSITIPELLQIPANVLPDKAAAIYEGAELSFFDLRHHALRMANALEALGVKKGDRVGIHLPNCPQYLVAYYASLMLGAIVTGLNPAYPHEELLTVARTTGLTTVFTLDETADRIERLKPQVSIERIIVSARGLYGRERKTGISCDLREGWLSFHDLLEKFRQPRRPRVQVETTDPAIIQFTGGTTGVPKGAVLSHANMIAAVMQTSPRMEPILKFIPPERRKSLIILPLYHVYGNLVANWSLFNCVTQVLVPRFQVDEVIDLLCEIDEITYFPAVPTMLTALVNHPRIGEVNLGRKVHVINSGAAPCPVELIERLRDLGVFITEAWGMSETSSLGIVNPILGKKKPGSIGLPAPDNDIRIVDVVDGKTEVPRGQPGELLIKGPSVMMGYWNNPEETAQVLKDGWLYTGDIVVQDEDGFIFIVDRKKDMIIAGGFNVYPREIDEVLYRHPKVKEAVTVGIPDPYRGETVKAFIVPKEGEEVSAEEIIAFCKERLAPYKVPKEVEFRASLPQSAAGKILRKVLREEEMKKRGEKN
ncbi:MAG TPA: long-chain fatty acid--CoA ligase [Syntrophales bacterium]|nr:long-chain fatty acid--CoA ligase [Syntrophales bacterium]HOL58766.1 long-chain fatty acid--CoA ligase [Syntrophales bacterium]HPO34946.1 long-chain fatty acid--CoA ligase [Syntrophales bacterium]